MSEKITLSGVPETMLQTVYARAKEPKTRGAITDNKAVELIDRLDTRCYRMSGYSPPDGRQPRRQTVSAAYKENAGALLLRIRQHGGPLQVPRRGEKSVSRRSFPCF